VADFEGSFQMKQKPFVLAGTCLILGYFHAAATRMQRPVSRESCRVLSSPNKWPRLRKMLLSFGRRNGVPAESTGSPSAPDLNSWNLKFAIRNSNFEPLFAF